MLSATSWFQNLTLAAQTRLLACGTVTVNEKDCIQPLDSLAQGLGLVVHGVVRVIPSDSEEATFLGVAAEEPPRQSDGLCHCMDGLTPPCC